MNKAKVIAAPAEYSETQRLVMLALLTIATYLLCVSPAFAGIPGRSKMAEVICSIYGIIVYDVGRALATLAIVALGIGAMLGRVTWGQLATVAVGIGVVIGAITLTFSLLPIGLGTTASLLACAIDATTAQAASYMTYLAGL